jgi:hypothetical protein
VRNRRIRETALGKLDDRRRDDPRALDLNDLRPRLPTTTTT